MKETSIESNRSGFTLIELLVVIAIIAILAAILFPVFAQAREKARQTTCASNEKQLGLGLLQYVQDYDEIFPNGYQIGPSGSGSSTVYGALVYSASISPTVANGWQWGQQIYTYVKSTGVYACPDSNTKASDTYMFNYNLVGITLAKLNAPASTVAVSEFGTPEAGSNAGVDQWDPSNIQDASISGFAADGTDYDNGSTANGEGGYFGQDGSGKNLPRHNTGINYLAADGHVKFLNPVKVSNGPGADKAGCVQEPNYTGPNCSPYGWNATGTDTMQLPGGTPVTLTYSYF